MVCVVCTSQMSNATNHKVTCCTAAILQILLYASVHLWDVPYQANLGLQLYLQGLQGPLELVDLTARGLEGLCAGCHLLVQLVKLEDVQLDGKMVTKLFEPLVNTGMR